MQLPLAMMAHASTAPVHKYQETTANHALVRYVPKDNNAPRSLVYVMMSRPTKLEDIVYLMEEEALRMEHDFNLPFSYRHKIQLVIVTNERTSVGRKKAQRGSREFFLSRTLLRERFS